jgi:hypothetical protein
MAAVLGERAIHGAIASRKPGNRATQGQGRSHQAGRAAAVGGVGLGTALEPGDSGEGGHTRRNPQSLPPRRRRRKTVERRSAAVGRRSGRSGNMERSVRNLRRGGTSDLSAVGSTVGCRSLTRGASHRCCDEGTMYDYEEWAANPDINPSPTPLDKIWPAGATAEYTSQFRNLTCGKIG